MPVIMWVGNNLLEALTPAQYAAAVESTDRAYVMSVVPKMLRFHSVADSKNVFVENVGGGSEH